MSSVAPPACGSDPAALRRGAAAAAPVILPPAVILPQLPAWLRPISRTPDAASPDSSTARPPLKGTTRVA